MDGVPQQLVPALGGHNLQVKVAKEGVVEERAEVHVGTRTPLMGRPSAHAPPPAPRHARRRLPCRLRGGCGGGRGRGCVRACSCCCCCCGGGGGSAAAVAAARPAARLGAAGTDAPLPIGSAPPPRPGAGGPFFRGSPSLPYWASLTRGLPRLAQGARRRLGVGGAGCPCLAGSSSLGCRPPAHSGSVAALGATPALAPPSHGVRRCRCSCAARQRGVDRGGGGRRTVASARGAAVRPDGAAAAPPLRGRRRHWLVQSAP
jgi:hypothetical protein